VGKPVKLSIQRIGPKFLTVHNDPTTLPCVVGGNFFPREHLDNIEFNDALGVGDGNVGQT